MHCYLAVNAQPLDDDNPLERIKTYISQGQDEQSWSYAKSLAAEYMGEPDFDFLYGIAALKVNENEHALYAFERVVANKPNWLDAKIYLAKAYFLMKNYHAVIEITESLNNLNNLPDNLKNVLQNLNQASNSALDKQSLYLVQSANFGVGYDSNINAGTREDNIFLPFLNEEILLSEQSRENSDNYVALEYQLSGSKALNRVSRLLFSGMSQLHYFVNESDYNRLSIAGNLRYLREFDVFTTTIGIGLTPLWLDDSFYRTKFGTTFGINKNLDQHWYVSAEAYLGKTKNDINQKLNTDDISIQASVQFNSASWRHALIFSYAQEESEFNESKHNNKDVKSIIYSSNFAIDQHWLLSANISYQRQDYQYQHPFFFEKRVDDMWSTGASLLYQYSKDVSYRLSANIQDKDSNLSLFSYQRSDINLSTRLSF